MSRRRETKTIVIPAQAGIHQSAMGAVYFRMGPRVKPEDDKDLTLPGLKSRVLFVDDVDAAFAADDTAILITFFG